MKRARYVYAGATLLVLGIALGIWKPVRADVGAGNGAVSFRVDPSWPAPLPAPNGHQWVTGEVGGSCIDSHDHLFVVNRGWQSGFSATAAPTANQLQSTEGDTSIPAPPVIEFDEKGNVVNAWGDTSKDPFTFTLNNTQQTSANGPSKVLPQGIHGCFVDFQDNVWIAGNGDGVVQKWSHDGKTMLLQIGTKGVCDGPARPASPANPYPTCGTPGTNTSHTLLNEPADIAVDPTNGDVYIADGYGNHRVVVFDKTGKYLRQWGTAGGSPTDPQLDPGKFGVTDGGHPHCVVIGKDGLVYVCDRLNNRIEVFAKNCGGAADTGSEPVCQPERIIPVVDPNNLPPSNVTLPDHTPQTAALGTLRACDIDFSPDKNQSLMFDTDLGNDVVWIMDRVVGGILGHFGRAGHQCGEFSFPHTVTTDSKGNVYVAETINGRRVQKFVRQGP